MGEESDYCKQTRLRDDWWLFVIAVGKHGHSMLTLSTGLGLLWLFEHADCPLPPWTVPWIVAISIVIGAFISWRKDRDARDKAQNDLKTKLDELAAVPNLTGTWLRNGLDTEPVEIWQEGDKIIRTKFKHGHVDHESKGPFNRQRRVFDIVTVRIDEQVGDGANSYLETWYPINRDTFAFYTKKNRFGNKEGGVLFRRT